MKSKLIIVFTMLTLAGLLTPGCKKESPVALTPHDAWTIPVPLTPAPGSFVDLQGATTINLTWESTNASGDTQNWNVYFGTSSVSPALVSTGQLTESYTATVAVGTKYYWKVVGTDKNGIKTSSEIWNFETIDPAAPLKMSVKWTTDAATVMGLTSIDPTEAANLRLLIYKADTVTLAVPVINTGGFEEFSGWNTLADGVYFVAVDLSKVINLGDLNAVFNISLNATFSQRGILVSSLSLGNIMTSENPCPLYTSVFAKVTKSGNSYTVEQDAFNKVPPTKHWSGTDATYAENGTYTLNCTGGILTGLLAGTTGQNGWMFDWWGEIIIDGGSCSYTVSGTDVTIPYQYFCQTTYLGAKQTPYYIQGTGTIDNSGAAPKWTLHYDIKQGGTWIGHYSFVNLGWATDGFDAVLNGSTTKSLNVVDLPRPPKPKR